MNNFAARRRPDGDDLLALLGEAAIEADGAPTDPASWEGSLNSGENQVRSATAVR